MYTFGIYGQCIHTVYPFSQHKITARTDVGPFKSHHFMAYVLQYILFQIGHFYYSTFTAKLGLGHFMGNLILSWLFYSHHKTRPYLQPTCCVYYFIATIFTANVLHWLI